MLNKFITKISPNVRILILVLLSLSLFLAKSIYLILFITTFVLMLFIITDKKVNLYVKTLKKMSLLLLIFVIAYIIIFRQYNIIFVITLIYKLIIILIFIKIFFINIEFKELHQGIYALILPLRKMNIDSEKISFDIVLSLYFIRYFMNSKEEIKNKQMLRGKKTTNIRNFLIPRLFYSINSLDRLQDSLKIKFYKLNYKKTNFSSKLILIMFIILFVVCLFKEVIL